MCLKNALKSSISFATFFGNIASLKSGRKKFGLSLSQMNGLNNMMETWSIIKVLNCLDEKPFGKRGRHRSKLKICSPVFKKSLKQVPFLLHD